ncbi:MAG: SRPBCC domain-containing protein, partial [Aestuariivirga sp.]
MTPQAKVLSDPADTLRITRVFAAPRALVYRMWTEKHLMDRWSCPTGFTMPDSGADLRPGGTWHATMRTADG